MTTSAFYLPNGDAITPSPRKPLWRVDLTGASVSFDPLVSPQGFVLRFFKSSVNAATPIYSALNGGGMALAAGDRISIERIGNAGAVGGLAAGARSVWRGIVHGSTSFISGGSSNNINLFMTLDGDSDPLPNAIIEHGAPRAGDIWRIYKGSGKIVPMLDRWYLYNLDDTDEVGGNLTDGRLTTRRNLHRLALLRGSGAAVAGYTAHLSVVRKGLNALGIAELDNRFGGGATVGISQKNAFGTGGENSLLSYYTAAGRHIQPAAGYAALMPAGIMSLQGFGIVAASGVSGAILFMADRVAIDTDYPIGFAPPLWRNYKQQTAVSESGALVARYTIPEPDDMDIPLRYISTASALGGVGTLVRRLQDNNFLFGYRDADVPMFYGWANDIQQPQFDAPGLMSGAIKARGYYRYA